MTKEYQSTGHDEQPLRKENKVLLTVIGVTIIVAAAAVALFLSTGMMNPILSFVVPGVLALVVVGGFLACTFEPYLSLNSDEAREMRASFAEEAKLQAIAEWWTKRLYPITAGGIAVRHPFYSELLAQLTRRRFMCGEDPGTLAIGHRKWWHIGGWWGTSSEYSLSPMLARAVALCEADMPPSEAAMLAPTEPAMMVIRPNKVAIYLRNRDGAAGFTAKVSLTDRRWLWVGEPTQYESRFGDTPDSGYPLEEVLDDPLSLLKGRRE
jgi:hypothetical protein